MFHSRSTSPQLYCSATHESEFPLSLFILPQSYHDVEQPRGLCSVSRYLSSVTNAMVKPFVGLHDRTVTGKTFR